MIDFLVSLSLLMTWSLCCVFTCESATFFFSGYINSDCSGKMTYIDIYGYVIHSSTGGWLGVPWTSLDSSWRLLGRSVPGSTPIRGRASRTTHSRQCPGSWTSSFRGSGRGCRNRIDKSSPSGPSYPLSSPARWWAYHTSLPRSPSVAESGGTSSVPFPTHLSSIPQRTLAVQLSPT